MSPERLELNRAVRALVAMATGIPAEFVSPQDQSLDIPAAPQVWATVKVTPFGSVGQDEVKYANATSEQVTEKVEGQRLCVASINIYRTGALDYADKLKSRVRLSNAVAHMQANNIGFIGFGPVNDLTAVEDEEWEERAQVDLQFYTSVSEDVLLDTYGTFRFELNTDDPIEQRIFTVEEP